MESKNLLTLTITLVVGIILAGSLLMPVISEATTETYTIENDGTPFKLISEAENPTIVLSKVGGAIVIESDGETVENPDFTLFGAASIVYGESGFIRLNTSGQLRGFADDFYGVNVTDTVTVTITFTEDNAIMTPSTGTAKTVPLKPTAYIGNGSYVQTTSPYINDTTTIYLAGNTNYDGVNHYISYVGYGVSDALSTATVFSDLGTGVTVESLTHVVNATNISANLYKLNNVQFTAVDSNDREYDATYSFLLAPHEIVYNNAGYMGAGYVGIVAAIPTILIAGLVVTAAGALYLKRDD